MRRRWWRGSLAVRLTVVATAVAAAALLVLLLSVYVVLSGRAQQAVDDGLRARYADVLAAVGRGDTSALSGELYAELRRGGTIERSPALQGAPPLIGDPVAPAEPRFVDRALDLPAPRTDVPLRVLEGAGPGGGVLAVGTSRVPEQEASRQLLVALAITGPLLLALVAAVVGRATRAALRPVDELARQAERISEGRDAARRLGPVEGDDELARLSHTLDAMLGRLAVAFERERAFVDDASHELRTPVTVLRGELELALSDLDDRPGVEQSLRAALAEAERLSRLAEDLLVLARERAGGLVLQHDAVEVTELLGRTASRLGPATGLDVAVCGGPLVLRGDATRLEQLLTNLIVNAAEAGARRVLLTATGDGDAVLLVVEDDGPGFPDGFADRAFERFSRADGARTRTTGAGLGLALVAAIAAAAGGTVRAGAGAALPGAAVTVRLPLG